MVFVIFACYFVLEMFVMMGNTSCKTRENAIFS